MKRKKNPLWYRIGVLIFGGIFCFSSYMAGRDIFEARKEAAAFRKLSEAASDYMETAEQKDSIVDPANDHTTEVENTAEAEEKQELLREAAGYASLAEQNPDYVGWLKIPGTRIDYPVMSRASDPEYYLHRAFDESRSSGGTPFLGQLSDKDSTCMIVYGHNMKNGGMFADVADFTNKEYFETHQKGKLYLTDATRKIRFFACMKVTAADAKIYHPDGYCKENLKDLLDYIQANAVQYRDVNVADENSLIALSTCSEAETNGRVVLIGKLEREVAEKQ